MPVWWVAGRPASSVQEGGCSRLQCLRGTFKGAPVCHGWCFLVTFSWGLTLSELRYSHLEVMLVTRHTPERKVISLHPNVDLKRQLSAKQPRYQ